MTSSHAQLTLERGSGPIAVLAPDSCQSAQQRVLHPQISRAISFIDQHLTDPAVNVTSVAETLGLNPNYLSHLFAQEAGTRMGRYIASRRIQLAKQFLASTDWQIKEVAFRSGHRSADWFSQIFRGQVGMTPGDYRQQVRQSSHPLTR